MSTIRNQISTLLKKVSLKTVTPEEGAILLNDLEKHTTNKEELREEFRTIYLTLPQQTHAKTFLQIIALTKNPFFEKMLIMGLEHPDESVVFLSLEGMARYKDDAAKAALIKQFANPVLHIRKAAGELIIKRWGVEGVKIIIGSGICHEERDVVNTACAVLAEYGVVVVPLVIDAMPSMNLHSLFAAAKLLVDLKENLDIQDHIDKERMVTLVRVLERVSGEKNPSLIIAVLESLGVLKDRLAGHEDAIAAYLHVEHSTIKLVAHKVLSHMDTDRAREIISSVKIPLGMGGFIMDRLPTTTKDGNR
jgi:hypothetical protein